MRRPEQNALPLQEQRTDDETPNTSVPAVANEGKEEDPYLALAREVRDKVMAFVDDAESGGGLGCLIACTNRREEETLWWWLKTALNRLREASACLEAAVLRIEQAAKPVPFVPTEEEEKREFGIRHSDSEN